MSFITDFIKARYWRAVIIGATTTEDKIWRPFLMVILNVLFIGLFMMMNIFESNAQIWRLYLGWFIVALLIAILPFNIITVLSYYNRHDINLDFIEPKFKKIPDLGKDLRMGIAAVIIGPPLIRYILGLFGIELEP